MPLPDIGGTLVYHYDAETLVLADGADVQLWADQSGNGRDLNAQTAAWPDYVASAINGKPGVKFLGSQNIHRFFTGVQPCTTFLVFAVAPNDVGSQVYVTPNITPFFVKWTQAGRWIYGTNDTNLIEFTDIALVGQPVLFTGVYRQTGAKLRANGVQRVSGNLAAMTTPGGAEFGFSSNGATETFTLCEMVQYDGELDTADIETIEAYLVDKWFPTTVVETADTQLFQTQTSAVNPWPVPKPTNLANGDYVVLIASIDGDQALSWPSGFTEIDEENDATAAFTLAAAFKPITDAGSEPATYDIGNTTGERGIAVALRVSGADGTTFLDVARSVNSGSGTTLTATGVTTVTDGALVLTIVGRDNAAGPWLTPLTSGWAEHVDDGTGGGASSGAGAAVAFKTQVTAGATGDVQGTMTSAPWVGFQVAIRPASGAPADDPANLQASVTGDDVTLTWDA